MSYGAYFIADDGTLLVSSEQPCYEFVADYSPTSRSGNVNTYVVNITPYPLVLINVGGGGAGGLLAIEGNPGNWVISVLATAGYSISVFRIVGGAPSGYGLATFASNGSLCFDSTRKILNSKRVVSIGNGSSTSTPLADMVSYTSGQVRTASSVSDAWVYVNTFLQSNTVYVCETQYIQSCSTTNICFPDGSGGQFCYPQTFCQIIPTQVCGFRTINTFYDIYARVRTTSWYIDRGVARLDPAGTGLSFDFLRHKEGFYKQVLFYAANTTSIGQNVPPGYIPPPAFISGQETFSGELTKNNTYPYTQTLNNLVNLTCITAKRSDYA